MTVGLQSRIEIRPAHEEQTMQAIREGGCDRSFVDAPDERPVN